MHEKVERLLADYEKRADSEARVADSLSPQELIARRDGFLLSVGRSVGELLSLLAKGSNAQRILELGTSYGYSTLWLAEAARCTGGAVVSVELHKEKLEYARDKLREAELNPFVELHLGDARKITSSLHGTFDFVLIDLWKELYIPCLDLLLPKLTVDALVIADNMCEPAVTRPYADAYRRHVRRTKRFDSVLLNVGSGIEVSRYLG